MNGDQNPATPPAGWEFHPNDSAEPQQPQNIQAAAPAAQLVEQTQQAAPAPAANLNLDEAAAIEAALPAQPTEITDEPVPTGELVQWSASEYIAHQKTAKWYTILIACSVLLSALVYFLAKDIIAVVFIMLIALVFGMAAARKPRVLDYTLDHSGLTIAGKVYHYGNFRSFAVIDEGAFSSIAFIPIRRFMPMLSIYYAPEDEDRIVRALAERLPMEQRKRDAFDTILHKIRF